MSTQTINKLLSLSRYSAAGAIIGSAIVGTFFNQIAFFAGGLDLKALAAIAGAITFLTIAVKYDFK